MTSHSDYKDLVGKVVHSTIGHKYMPKLNHARRCAMLAAHMAGYRLSVLSKGFDVHYRTTRDICVQDSRKYKKVKDELVGLGVEAFTEKYLTPTDIELLNTITIQEGEEHSARQDEKPASVPGNSTASKRASRLSGQHLIDGRTVDIEWNKDGWYWKEDGEEYGPHNTSQDAHKSASESF